jgi:hypothetical protein
MKSINRRFQRSLIRLKNPLVSHGGQFMFLKLMRQDECLYGLSDEFSLYRQRNELCDVLGYHRKAGQKGTAFLFVSSNLSRLKRVPIYSKY